MNKKTQAEIVVIGGGVVGTAVAAFLAQAGQDVALVERGDFPNDSSKRCDGHVVTYDSAPGFFSVFSKKAQDVFRDVVPLLPCDVDFEPEGLGLLVDDEQDMEALLETRDGKQKEGINVSFWDQAELRRREPFVADKVLGCLNFENDAKLNPMRLAFGLSELARQHRAQLHPGVHVRGIGTQGGNVTHVETDSGTITANKVVLCAGVWTPELAGTAGVSVPIRPRQGQILVTERTQGLVSQNYAEYGYLAAKGGKVRKNVTQTMEKYGVAMVLEPTAAQTTLIGSSRRYVGLNTMSDPRVLQAMAQRAIHFFPRFRDVRAIRSYAGLRPCTPDGKPIISTCGVGGLYIAAGHEGNGISLSLITGRLITQMICGQPTDVDVDAFRLERFSN